LLRNEYGFKIDDEGNLYVPAKSLTHEIKEDTVFGISRLFEEALPSIYAWPGFHEQLNKLVDVEVTDLDGVDVQIPLLSLLVAHLGSPLTMEDLSSDLAEITSYEYKIQDTFDQAEGKIP
jgi:hypothetical protein